MNFTDRFTRQYNGVDFTVETRDHGNGHIIVSVTGPHECNRQGVTLEADTGAVNDEISDLIPVVWRDVQAVEMCLEAQDADPRGYYLATHERGE